MKGHADGADPIGDPHPLPGSPPGAQFPVVKPGRFPLRRRTVLLLLLALGLGGGLLSALPGPRTGLPPHIILVVWDTCRIDRLSAFGYRRPTTPWLESFSREGVRYTGCIAAAPWTAPSHASLFTGLRPSRHGLRVEVEDRVRPHLPLLAATLRQGGYETVGVSANGVVSAATGLDAGFETFRVSFEGEEKPPAVRTAALVRSTLEEVLTRERDPGRPLFLYVNFLDAHLPHAPPPGALEALGIPRPPAALRASMEAFDTRMAMGEFLGRVAVAPEEARVLGDLHDGDIRTLDEETGRLFAWLEEKGLLEDSLVILTSDHGDNLGEHGEFGHRLSVHEPLLRVPLVIRWPDGRGAGTVEPAMASLMDLHPTILEAAGLAVPPHTGLDARPLTAPPDAERRVLAEYGPVLPFIATPRALGRALPARALEPLRWMFQVAYSGGAAGPEWKLERRVRFADDESWSPVKTRLFNVRSDPGEEVDLLEGEPSLGIRDMRRWLEEGLDPPSHPNSGR